MVLVKYEDEVELLFEEYEGNFISEIEIAKHVNMLMQIMCL